MAPTNNPRPSDHGVFPFLLDADGVIYVTYDRIVTFCDANPEFFGVNLQLTLNDYYRRACAFRGIAYDATTVVRMILTESMTPEERAILETTAVVVDVEFCSLCRGHWTNGHVCGRSTN